MAASRLALRRSAIARSLFPPTHLGAAIDRLGFVQADPIRSPARAQDLILRQRVSGYRAGDLEREYPSLDVEEDYLYAYGVVSRRVWQLLHPRQTPRPKAFEKKVLEAVTRLGEAHPRVLEGDLGKRRVVNAWGGYSKATTHALEWLHWRGLLRVARRENGIRVYTPVRQALVDWRNGRLGDYVLVNLPISQSSHLPIPDSPALPSPVPTSDDRLRALMMVYARIFAPAPERSLQSVVSRHRDLGNTRRMLTAMIETGELRRDIVDGVSYLSPADAVTSEVPPQVRFLAPFDPIVWDRTRFEHLWGWAYRFEAYTPVKKRVRGYYAMPMLWQDNFIGWVNASVAGGRLDVQVGYVGKQPRGSEFRRELDREIARLSAFLEPRPS
jgi:uncharacterized protein